MKYIKLNAIDDIKQGDALMITGDKLQNRMVRAEIVKISDADGTEVIIDKKKNKFFNVGMYLQGKSWVKECYILRSE